MSALSIQPTYPIFTDIDGQPLEAGYVWLGQANLDPQVNPINVYWDAALTIAAPQPIRTLGGYPSRNGTPARLYVNSDYSIRVMNRNGSTVYSAPEATERYDAATITYLPAGTGAVATTVQNKLRDYVSVHDFMTAAQITDSQSGSPTLDMTSAVQNAINTNKSVYFPKGIYLVDEITLPVSASSAMYYGDGFYHYDATRQTVIKARTLNQNSIFKIAQNGAGFTFENLRLEGDSKAVKVVDGTYGPFLSFVNCGVYNGISYGVYSLQGLMRIDRCFMAGSNIQCHMYSDSAATDSEFTGGAIALKLVAGGNRLSNIWANSCTAACVSLEPYDNSTNHFNTSIVNLYAGEVFGTNRPVINIVGTSGNPVRLVQLSNSFIVTAVADTNKVDGGIYLENANDISINNVQFFGLGLFSTPTSYTPWSIIAWNNVDSLGINNCVFRSINRNPIYLNNNIGSVNITGCSFQDWDLDENAVGAEAAAIRVSSGRVSATGNTFRIGGAQTQPYVVDVANSNMIVFDNNYMAMPTPTLAAGTGIVSGFNRASSVGAYFGRNVEIYDSIIGDSTVNNAGRNFLQTGLAASAGSGVAETLNLTTLANTAQQQVYIATASQQSGSSNTVMYMLNVYGSSAKAVRVAGDTASPGATALDFQFTGLQLQLVVGSGFGATGWRWAITRLV
jgi:hypothetical protein